MDQLSKKLTDPSAILQRVTSASVTVDKQLISSIGKGILCFAAVGPEDSQKDADSMALKVVKLKMWPESGTTGVALGFFSAKKSMLIHDSGRRTFKTSMARFSVVSSAHTHQ